MEGWLKTEGFYSTKRQEMLQGGRVLIWFSCGATSAVAAKLALHKYKDSGKQVEVLYCDTGGEHPSNKDFLASVEAWLGVPIKILKNKRYKDHFDVYKKHKHIKLGGYIDCTNLLKKSLRQSYEDPIRDIQVFGFEVEERTRASRFRQNNQEVYMEPILIDKGLSKADCFALLSSEGLALPALYQPQKSGAPYNHNNCLGCPKGSAPYWNKIRLDFPKVFQKMARLEKELGQACIVHKGVPVFLSELPLVLEEEYKGEEMSCSILCQDTLDSLSEEGK